MEARGYQGNRRREDVYHRVRGWQHQDDPAGEKVEGVPDCWEGWLLEHTLPDLEELRLRLQFTSAVQSPRRRLLRINDNVTFQLKQ